MRPHSRDRHPTAKDSLHRRLARALVALTLLTALVGMPGVSLTSAQSPATPAATPELHLTAKLDLAPSKAKIGDTITATGSGYPANAKVDLVYHSVKGHYSIESMSEFVGQTYDETTQVLTTATADQSGAISAQFTVPGGYGGPHDIRGSVDGKEISQAGLIVQPTITMTPAQGPVGTMITLTIKGVDLRPKVNTWQVLYDNHYLGFAGAVTTNGTAVAQFRATGPVGAHYIQVWNNSYQSTPYMAWDTSPFRNDFSVGETFTFNATSDPGYIAPQIEDFSKTDNPWPLPQTYAGKLALSVDRGIVGAATTLTGSNLPANAELSLSYVTMVGNRVSAIGFSEQSVPITTVKTDANGAFSYPMNLPDDLGGSHRLEASVGDQVVAATGFVILPSVLSVSATTAHVGDTVTIHMKGLGWTTYDNAYVITYDNSDIGYVCGFSTNGDVQFHLLITGAPGTHLIDLYPTIYEGKNQAPDTYWVPQLTYAQDHPGRTLPAIRLTIEVVG